MKGKFLFGGEGVNIPGINLPLSFALFKIWLCPTGLNFRGYTAGSNNGLLGAAIIETPVVDFVMRDLEDEEPFFNLHGATLDVTLTTMAFLRNNGFATIKLARRSNDVGAAPQELTFYSDECTGGALVGGDIRFTTTLVELNADEFDPTGRNYLGL